MLMANQKNLVEFAIKLWRILAVFPVILKFTLERNPTSVNIVEWDSLKGIVIFPRSINIAFLSNCANEILSKGVTEVLEWRR